MSLPDSDLAYLSAAGKVTVGLMSHWPCITDSVVYPLTSSKAVRDEPDTYAPVGTWHHLSLPFLLAFRTELFDIAYSDSFSQWLNLAGTGRNGVPPPLSGVPPPEVSVPPPKFVVPPPGDAVPSP